MTDFQMEIAGYAIIVGVVVFGVLAIWVAIRNSRRRKERRRDDGHGGFRLGDYDGSGDGGGDG